jgi:hypothetical protein
MNDKKKYGQFMTTNYNYILEGFKIPNICNIIEPFAGNGDLLKFIQNSSKYTIECYDIQPKHDFIIKRDTLKNPPNYSNKWILTNPPYLARNKCNDKQIFDKYLVNDLYKCFIKEILTNICIGGILIIPLNFFSSIRPMDVELRKNFTNIYNILTIKIFEENVFDDTTYTVCAFQFEHRKKEIISTNIFIKPSNKQILNFVFNNENNYTIGGEITMLPKSNYKISRLIKNDIPNTNILVKCIDDNINNKIQLKIVPDNEIYFDTTPNKSARTYATLLIEPKLSIEKQKELVDKFNEYLHHKREKYNSLFLCNYRESKNGFSRKRISFELVYDIVSFLLI